MAHPHNRAFQEGDKVLTSDGYIAIVTSVRWDTVNVKYEDPTTPLSIAIYHADALRLVTP